MASDTNSNEDRNPLSPCQLRHRDVSRGLPRLVGAMITHLRHGGFNKFVVLNLTYLALAAFIAWGRFGPESFTA
jgi:hypothetical protein